MTTRLLVLLAAGPLTIGCSGDLKPADSDTDVGVADATADAVVDVVAGEPDAAFDIEPDTQPDREVDVGPPPPNPDCDPLVALECAMPWPSNLYLEEDPSRVTGVTLSFGATSLPLNYRRVHLRPEIYQ